MRPKVNHEEFDHIYFESNAANLEGVVRYLLAQRKEMRETLERIVKYTSDSEAAHHAQMALNFRP